MSDKTIPIGMIRALPKEIRAIVKQALATPGWRGQTAASGRGHLRFYPADRSIPPITVSKTSSDRRALDNIRADFRNAGLEV